MKIPNPSLGQTKGGGVTGYSNVELSIALNYSVIGVLRYLLLWTRFFWFFFRVPVPACEFLGDDVNSSYLSVIRVSKSLLLWTYLSVFFFRVPACGFLDLVLICA